ncbi:Gfo/Idh/MocA family oxidoreductase [Oscillospiraceae bacterium PP1C4]
MVQIGIVGAGGMGTVHYSNYAHIEDCKVAAIVGKSEQDKKNAALWGIPLYEDIKSMVNHEQIDVVDVCTPTFLHKQHVMESLAHGKHTITEKPIALCKKDAQEMFALAKEKGVQLLVAQVLQFTKEVAVLRELVQSGEYGKPLDAYFERLSAAPKWAQGGWLFEKEKSGLVPFDLHIHDLDIIVSLFGKPDEIAFTSCGGADKAYKEHYRFLYTYHGLNVAAEAGWLNADIPFTARWRVYFENAMVVNDGTTVTAYQFGKAPRIFDTKDEIKIPTGINVPPTGWYLSELSHFMQCIKQNKPSTFVSDLQILTVLDILEKFE